MAGRAHPAADARHLAEQVPRRPARERVPGVLPGERRRVLRQLLRLLPAGGVRPVVGYLYRERLLGERRDRPAAALGDLGPPATKGRADRRERVLYLRPGVARAVRRPPLAARARRGRADGLHQAAPRQHAVQPERLLPRARHIPRARRHDRDPSRVRRDDPSHRAVRRHGRADDSDRARLRRDRRRRRRHDRLRREPLRCKPGADGPRDGIDRGGARASPEGARVAEQAARSTTASDAHDVRPGDDARDGLLFRDRELLAAHRRARAGGGAVHLARLLSRRLSLRRRRVARHRAADQRHVRRRHDAEAHARRARVPLAERDGQPAAEVRGVAGEGRAGRVPLGDAGVLRASRLEASRRTGGAPDRPRRPRGPHPAHQGPDRRPHRGDPRARRVRRADARDDADEEDGRRPDRVPGRVRPARSLHALGDRHDPTYRAAARPTPRRVRHPDRHQPPPRGARPARGVAGRDPRRRQRRLPPVGDIVDPDDRARRAQRERPSDHVRGRDNRLDEARDQRDEPPPPETGRVQQGPRHRAGDDPQEGQ